MFKADRKYKHRNCLDMVIEVAKVQYRGPDYWKVRVWYHTRTLPLRLIETVKIQKKDFWLWDEWRPLPLLRTGN